MKNRTAAAASMLCLLLGAGIGHAAKEPPPGVAVMANKPPAEAGLASLQEAEKLAGDGSWELLGVARVYFLIGNKAKGQELVDRVLKDPADTDWRMLGQLYAEIGDPVKADAYFTKAVAELPKDDIGQAEMAATYIRLGMRAKGEALFAKAAARNPGEMWHYVRVSEAFLNVPAGARVFY